MDWLALSIGRSGSQPLEYSSIDFILRDKRLLYTYCNEPIYLKSLGEGYHIDEIEERLTDK